MMQHVDVREPPGGPKGPPAHKKPEVTKVSTETVWHVVVDGTHYTVVERRNEKMDYSYCAVYETKLGIPVNEKTKKVIAEIVEAKKTEGAESPCEPDGPAQ